MSHSPQGAAREQVLPKRMLQVVFVVLNIHTHTASQIPFSGSLSNWVEGFNYNHLRKNKYPFSASGTKLSSLPSTLGRSIKWLTPKLLPAQTPPAESERVPEARHCPLSGDHPLPASSSLGTAAAVGWLLLKRSTQCMAPAPFTIG